MPAPLPKELKSTPILLTKYPNVENTVIPEIISNDALANTVIKELFTISHFLGIYEP